MGLCWPILGLCWPILGLCWSILGAMLAHLGGYVGPCWPILSHKIRKTAKKGKSTKHRKTRQFLAAGGVGGSSLLRRGENCRTAMPRPGGPWPDSNSHCIIRRPQPTEGERVRGAARKTGAEARTAKLEAGTWARKNARAWAWKKRKNHEEGNPIGKVACRFRKREAQDRN